MRLRWTPIARRDLRRIKAYIAQDSEYYATLFVANIIEAAESLVRFPKRGRRMPESEDEAVRELIFQNYRIIYRLSEDEISIAMVIHAARDLDAIMTKPWEVH